MNLMEIKKKIKADTWWSEEAPAVPLFCTWMQQFVEQSKYWHPTLPNIIFCFIKNDFVYEETPEKQKIKIWNYVLKQYLRNPNVQHIRYKQWSRIKPALVKKGEYFLKHGRQMSNAEFINSFIKVGELLREHWRFTWVQECADVFTTYYLPDLFKKEKSSLSLDQATDLAITLTAPTVLSFMELYHVALLKFAIKHYAQLKGAKNLPYNLLPKLDKITHQYIWLLSNYKEGRALTWRKVWSQIKFELKKNDLSALKVQLRQLQNKGHRNRLKQQSLYKILKLSSSLKKTCELLSWWARWIDERKQVALMGNWYLEHYAKGVARRLGVDIWRVKYMLLEEIVDGLKGKPIISINEFKKRRKLSLFLTVKSNGMVENRIITGHLAQKLWQAIFPPLLTKEIKGQVASAPVNKIEGVVQVVLDPHCDKFTTGRILVTTMTRPDFVPYMRKAKAIVTDEGGLTSHAAIVSRELGIPIIIGTRVASKVLKTGNKVTLDMIAGTVQRLSH